MQRSEVHRRCVKYDGTDEDFYEILQAFIELQDNHFDYLIDEGEFDINNVDIWL